MPTVDYDAEYNNRARVPKHPEIIAGWPRDAAAFRETADAELGIVYGDRPKMALDLFHPQGRRDAPLVVFIHGGYWQAFDRLDFSHLASGLNARGIAVAIPGYDLCPAVSMSDIVGELRAAAAFLHRRTGRRMVAAGHSAGGHLAATLVATDWSAVAPDLPADLVPAGLAISGLFDLVPLVGTRVNTALGLDVAAARALSPLRWPVPPARSFEAWVGAEESSEYLRQSGTVADVWAAAGAATAFRLVPGANHFTAIAPLTDPASPMVEALAGLARQV